MPNQPLFLHPDGTSQTDRIQRALDPGYIAVDERSIKDLLAFAQKYAAELRYFNEHNEANGDWSSFLGDNNLDEIVAYLNDPGRFQSDSEKSAQFTRPHLVLFLTFLELLQRAREQLNDLTRRHLDFYYREALRLTSRKGVPDKVHAIVQLVTGQDQFLLPAGSLLKAGQDSLGNDLFYATDENILANRASVATLKSLFAERVIIGIREARETPDLLVELFPENKDLIAEGKLSDRTFMAMLSMILGTPGPGSPLPIYPVDRPVSAAFFDELDVLLAFIPSNLYMPFSTFRSVMALKQQQTQSGAQWQKVNDTLEAAGKRRDASFSLDRSQPDNFEKNLLAALGRTAFGTFFDGLPEVEDIYDLYRRRDRDDVIEFIQQSLYMSVDEFTTMMDIVEEINGRWRQIYEILRSAGRKKQLEYPDHTLALPSIRSYDADKFGVLVGDTLGTITYPQLADIPLNSFDDCYAEIVRLEGYFHMTAEKFVSIRATNQKQQEAKPWEWDQVYAILEAAHAEKALFDRWDVLKAINTDKTQGFDAMIRFALGDPNPGDPLPDLREFSSLDASADKNYIIEKLFLDPINFLYIQTTQAKGKKATEEEWHNVYVILELADRRKRGWRPVPPTIEKWDNIYIAEDATQVQVQTGVEGEVTTPRWRTFGEGYPMEGEDRALQTTPGDIGFAIASPLLALSEGTRTITLTLAFREEEFDKASIALALKDPSPFRFLLTGEKKMTEIKNASLQLLDASFEIPGAEKPYQHALRITLTLNEQDPAVAPLTINPPIQTSWPVLQILLADLPDETKPYEGPLKRYRAFQHLALEKFHLSVDVSGITKLTLQNDDGSLESKKPFEPFGSSPVIGSSFYIAHPELCSKRLDQLRLDIDWMAAPDDLSDYYLGYKDYADAAAAPASPIVDNTSFKADLKLYDNRSFFDVTNVQLFNAGTKKNTGASQTNQLVIPGDVIVAAYPGYQREIYPTTATETLDWSRYWQMELLAPDFQHSIYSRVATGCASKTTPYIVNAPYTPKIKHLSVGYSTSLEIDLTNTDLSAQVDRLYHIEPFGYRDLAGVLPSGSPVSGGNGGVGGVSFLPQYDNEGELFIGIKDLSAPQDLSLLFQMAEGSADPSLERKKIAWTFLDGDNWRSLEEGQMLSDSTNGLLNSGIVKFSLLPIQAGTRLPADQYWIRATIPSNSRSVGDTVAISAQVVSATFVDHDNAPDHLSQPLPAESVTGLVETLPQVQTVSQPYSSFGGKSQEQDSRFYIRASERLRHKNRALTCWDYEHMVLEAFPTIFKVKCLPVGASEDPALADVVQVITIPDIKGKLPFDPFEPKSPADVLFQIEQYLAGQCAPFARFKVKNPTYLRLKVRIGVRLRPDANSGYYKNALNEELQHYLAPWAYDRSAEIVFGGQINASLIINFVEERPYVDYVAGIKLFISPDGRHFTPYTEGSTFTPDAIIVSDRSHEIDLIAEEGYEEQFFTGINYLKIELDFQIAAG